MKINQVDEKVIADIGRAFAFYDYGAERGLVSAFAKKEQTAIYIEGFVRAMLKAGFLYTTSERQEGFIAYKRPGEKVRLSATLPLLKGVMQSMTFGEAVRFARCMGKGGTGLKKRLEAAVKNAETGKGATVFGYYVDDPERFGIVEFDNSGKAISIEEKPEKPKSNYCVTGLYFYDNRVVEFAKNLKPSARGELEITDLNRIYLEDGTLNVELLGQGFTWLDTGTHESLVDATNFVKTVETHQHRKIACLEEIAYLNGWISKEQVLEEYEILKKNQYGQYLKDVLDGKYIDA